MVEEAERVALEATGCAFRISSAAWPRGMESSQLKESLFKVRNAFPTGVMPGSVSNKGQLSPRLKRRKKNVERTRMHKK